MAGPGALVTLHDSIQRFQDYPTNLLCGADPTDDFNAYKAQLRNTKQLFISNASSSAILLQFLDFPSSHSTSVNWVEEEIHSDAELGAWLEVGKKLVPQQATTAHALTNIQPPITGHQYPRDPKCRFIFIHAKTSRDPLKVTHEMFVRILTYHQVMPEFINFVSVFGFQAESRGRQFCDFKTRSQLKEPAPTVLVDSGLHRSGRYYQLCYNLRSARQSRLNQVWTVRQTVFYHHFDVVYGTALWISAQGDHEMRKTLSPAAKNLIFQDFRNVSDYFKLSLDIHTIHCQWCTKGWRTYIESMDEELDVYDTLLARAVWGNPGEIRSTLSPSDLQKVQVLERKSNEAVMTLHANIDILSSLQEFYSDLKKTYTNLLPGDEWYGAVDEFSKRLETIKADIRRFQTRAERIVHLAAEQKSLVIKQLEFQSSKKMEELTIQTKALGILAQREAVAVRIITIVSLIYLPCSIVSSIFSTDIIKFQDESGSYTSASGQSYSWLALQRWLEVTLPLTVATMLFGYIGYQLEKARQAREMAKENDKERKAMGGSGRFG